MKYAIKREFGIYRRVKILPRRAVLHFAKFFLSVVPKGMRSSKALRIEKVKTDRFKSYFIQPKCQAKQTIFYLHGGGFVFRGAPYHYRLAKIYALRAQANVVFVDYSLAFERDGHPLRDCLEAYRYFLANGQTFGIEEDKICLAGDSAGAYLALALYDGCRRENLPLPSRLMLVYPVVDPAMQSDSMKRFPDTPMWNSRANAMMWKIYSEKEAVFDPLGAALGGFPETYLETAEFDCLHDEGIALADRLSQAGATCERNETEGTMHGYDIKLRAPTTKTSLEKRIAFLRK